MSDTDIVKGLFQSKFNKLNPSNLIQLIRICMEYVDNKQLTGLQKKENVKVLLKEIIDALVPDEYIVIQNMLQYVVDPVIDNLVDASRGNLRINTKQKWCCT